MIKTIWSWLFGRISESDARDTYLTINQEINSLMSHIKHGYWAIDYELRNYEKLKLTSLHKLMPSNIINRIENLFQKEEQFNKLKELSDKEVYNIFGNYLIDDAYDDEGLRPKIYPHLFKNQLNFENLNQSRFKFDKDKFDELKKKVNENKHIQDFLKFKIDLENEGNKLIEDLINSYKRDVLRPENRRTILTISSIILTVILAGGTIWAAYSSHVLAKNQFEITQRQLDSISPLKSTLEVSLDIPEDRKIPVWDLAKIRKHPDGSEDFEKMEIRFILSNIGRMRTGFINAYLRSSFTDSPSEHIENILGESASFLEFEVWYNKCFEESKLIKVVNGSETPKHIINPECNFRLRKVPLGWHDFNLTLYCPFCSEQSKVYKFQFCIFDENDSSREACNKEPNLKS